MRVIWVGVDWKQQMGWWLDEGGKTLDKKGGFISFPVWKKLNIVTKFEASTAVATCVSGEEGYRGLRPKAKAFYGLLIQPTYNPNHHILFIIK